jgi:hypothetical protein
MDSTGNVLVGYYDHENHNIETKVLHANFEKDDHDNPSLFIDKTGRLMVFYSKHATGNEPIFLARARTPEAIDEWQPAEKLHLNDTAAYAGLSNTYTYTNVFSLKNEADKLFLFWRGADFKPNFSISTDGGNTWSRGKILILPERIYKDRRPYIKITSNNKDAIHFAFTDGHPNAEPTNSIYYAKYKEGILYKANGEKITDWSSLPLDPRNADVVFDARASKEKAWIWDVAENTEGNPVLVYAKFPDNTHHVYYYSIFDSGKWNHFKLTDSGRWFPDTPSGQTEREPNYSGGIVLDHDDPSTLYLSRQKNGVFEIEKWVTPDKGNTWNVTEVTKNSTSDNVRPFVIRNHPKEDSFKLLWMNTEKYIHYTDYRSAIKMW